ITTHKTCLRCFLHKQLLQSKSATQQKVIVATRLSTKNKFYNVFSTSFIFLTASALLLKAAVSSSFKSNSRIFSQPYLPMIPGTPRQISVCPYSPSRLTQQVNNFFSSRTM